MPQNPYEEAKKRIEAKIGFFIHLAVYLMVNGFLIIMNLFQSNGTFWAGWPLAGWGLGLLFHGAGVFLFSRLTNIKEKWIQKELSK